MAILKSKEISKMSLHEIEEKIKELSMELIKNRVNANKGGKLKTREMKRTIARLMTFNRKNQPQSAATPEKKETATRGKDLLTTKVKK